VRWRADASADVHALVVGLGFAGATVARALADRGWRVHAIERRHHIGGNAFDEIDAHGVRVHRYGPHAFHTNAERVVDFLSRFSGWHPYAHRVRVRLPPTTARDELVVPFPINRTTLSALAGRALDEAEAAAWLERAREPRDPILTSEDLVLATVGRELGDLFFRGYSKKHWGLDLSELAVAVAARIPVRTSDDDRYFTDAFQALPADGFTAMFERMLADPAITCELGRAFDPDDTTGLPPARHLVFTGPIDLCFGARHGRLPYRSVRFEHRHLPGVAWHQPVAQVNHPDPSVPWYRVTEFKHMTGQAHAGTSLCYEHPDGDGDPHYPIPRAENEALYQRYRELAEALPDVTFVGRLAQYRYFNMDQVVGAGLVAARRIDARLRGGLEEGP